jgi:hypothetical protein
MSRDMKFIFDGEVEFSLSEAMIEAVFKEWEAQHPGQNARAMGADEFTDRLMKKFRASGRQLPRGNA